jgi:GMP synthase-like glutamine amidotransferase
MVGRTIFVLVTNTDESDFAQAHEKDAVKFATMIASVRPDWRTVPFQVKDGVFPLSLAGCDGVIITGSPASVHDDEPWIAPLLELIRELDRARMPTVGVCFGHQAIAAALGGTISRNPGGWGFGVAVTDYAVQEPWMQPPQARVSLYSAHNEQVTALPPRARLLGGSPFCPVGAFGVDQHIMTTEHHPEMTPGFFAALVEAFADYVGPAVAARARAEARLPTDGAVFAEWTARFLEMPR